MRSSRIPPGLIKYLVFLALIGVIAAIATMAAITPRPDAVPVTSSSVATPTATTSSPAISVCDAAHYDAGRGACLVSESRVDLPNRMSTYVVAPGATQISVSRWGSADYPGQSAKVAFTGGGDTLFRVQSATQTISQSMCFSPTQIWAWDDAGTLVGMASVTIVC